MRVYAAGILEVEWKHLLLLLHSTRAFFQD